MSYPPEPWVLHGRACVAVWLVRAAAVPGLPVRVVTVFGWAVVGVAFVDYRPPGMAYHEVVAAVVVRDGWRVGVSIPRIWVDSPASQAGGRELWGIPKQRAGFDWGPGWVASARDDRGPIASVRARPSRFGVRLPVAGSTWQAFGAGLARTPLRATGRVTPVRAAWHIDPKGPLAWLLPRRPLLSLAVRGLRLTFGPRHRWTSDA
ncbi:acetoacetate decarboxylase family protein [Saccharothrix sp. S26]|uniref:acetoacetate decarboxylase family protein n=1 Tax=Saccharothrix sp. S26 TaxID=2907215 RepID=UPI001F3B3404|nr:acetoacetate decarboxylase family protein [Saccharothrix sp. S26]MCE7001164.1 acetoacetate decarboxylase family protein [Saccharothrix sp. S26]